MSIVQAGGQKKSLFHTAIRHNGRNLFSSNTMPEKLELDRIDRQLLDALQHDASLSLQTLSERVGLSTTPCWKRLKRLEDAGVIERRVAVLNRQAVGLPVTVFVSVRTLQHDEKWLAQFAAAVAGMPEVLEFHRMSGDVDYLLKVATADIAGYDRFYKRLIRAAQLSGVSSAFSMEQIKCTTALPLEVPAPATAARRTARGTTASANAAAAATTTTPTTTAATAARRRLADGGTR
jgi:Lrp/AsnC family transcriptional regulator